MKDYKKRYHIVRGEHRDGTWLSKGYVSKIAAFIAAKIESANFDGKVYVFDMSANSGASYASTSRTLAIYNAGKKDHETMEILGIT